MSAFGGKADIAISESHVSFRPIADVDLGDYSVRYATILTDRPLLDDASNVSDVCAAFVLWDHRQGLELLCRGRWLDQFDGPAPA
jgi:hypothetical protein